jgi:ABC-type uncharacterized transport system substrate-binding protein
MDRRVFLGTLAGTLLAAPLVAEGQQAGKVRRVGVLALGARPATLEPGEKWIEQGLQEQGYIEGKNLIVEHRYADGDRSRFPTLAANLVRSGVEVIIVAGPGPLQAARQATSTIPIVMAAGSADPVTEGLAASLARPGGNVTGVTYAVSSERFAKQLELLKAASGVSRIAVLWDLDIELFRRAWGRAAARSRSGPGARGSGAGPSS